MPESLSIKDILPHRQPMLMINKVLGTNEHEIHCQTEVSHKNPFLNDGFLPGFLGLELIAQASGLYLGLSAERQEPHETPSAGAIVAVRGLELKPVVVKAGDTLDIIASFLGGNKQAAMFSGLVQLDGQEVCRVTVTIAGLEG